MTIKVRTLSDEERERLNHWQRSDNVVGYRRSWVVQLSAQGWRCGAIAEALGLHIERVRQTIKDFNQGGIDAIAPQPRSRAGEAGALPARGGRSG